MISVYTVVGDGRVLVAFVNGQSAFVGQLPDSRFIITMCSSTSHSVEAYAFSTVEGFKQGIAVIGG